MTKRKNGRWVQVGEPMVGGRGFGIGYRQAYQDLLIRNRTTNCHETNQDTTEEVDGHG